MFLFGLSSGAADDWVETWHNLEIIGVPAVFRHTAFQVMIEFLGTGECMLRCKHPFCYTCRQFVSRSRTSRPAR
jgi:hypothetical protein